MELIEYVELPSFERSRKERMRRNFAVVAGVVGIGLALEKYNGGVSRALKSIRRGLTAAIASWIEDHGGLPMFTLEGDEPPPLTQSVLDLKLLDPRASLDGDHAPQGMQHLSSEYAGSSMLGGGLAYEEGGSDTGMRADASHLYANADTPQFFQSTKFFACLDVEEAKLLFSATRKVWLAPHEVLFRTGDPSDSGIFIVVRGCLGVFLEDGLHRAPIHANTLRYGESVGDLDVVDGAARTVSCMALGEPCLLVNLPRALFMDFVHHHPRALLLYLQQGIARLWRVAHFVLSDFLQLQLHKPPPDRSSGGGPQGASSSDKVEQQAKWQSAGCSQHAAGTDACTQTEQGGGSAMGSQLTPLGLGSGPGLGINAQRMPSSGGASTSDQASEGGAADDAHSSQRAEPHAGSQRSVPRWACVSEGNQALGDAKLAARSASEGGGQELSSTDVPAHALGSPPTHRELLASAAADTRMRTQQHGFGPSQAFGLHGASQTGQPIKPYRTPSGVLTMSHAVSSAAAYATAPGSSNAFSRLSTLPQQPSAYVAGQQSNEGALGAAPAPYTQSSESGVPSTALCIADSCIGTQLPKPPPSPAVPSPFSAGVVQTTADESGVARSDASQLPGRPTSVPASQPTDSAQAPAQPAASNAPSAAPPNAWPHSPTAGYKAAGAFTTSPTTSPSMPAGPACRLPRSQTLRRNFVLGRHACLREGWDVVDALEGELDGLDWGSLADPRLCPGSLLPLAEGALLHDVDWACGCFYLVVEGHLLAERRARHKGDVLGNGGSGAAAGPHANGGLGGAGRSASGSMDERLESALVSPGSLVGGAAFLSSTSTRSKVVALESCRLMAVGWQHLEALALSSPQLMVALLLAASRSLGPIIRRFISLGLNRVWLQSGDVAYRQGEPAECLYVVISGRLRLVHESRHQVTHRLSLHVEEEVGRGEAVGAVWAITGGAHDTSALCVRDSELVRMSRQAFRVISEDSPLALSKLFSNIARRLVAAWDSRVRSGRLAMTQTPPLAQAPLPNPSRLGLAPIRSVAVAAGGGNGGTSQSAATTVRNARAKRGEIATIAIVPAGALTESAAHASAASASAVAKGDKADSAIAAAAVSAAEAAAASAGWHGGPWPNAQAPALATMVSLKRLALALKEALTPFGPVLLLNSTTMGLQFPTAFERLDVLFYRSKLTSWMASQEEEYRFILLEADVGVTPWSSVCVAQADAILLVAPEGAAPALSGPEKTLVFAPPPSSAAPRHSGLTPMVMTPAASQAHLAGMAGYAGSSTASQPSLFSPPPRNKDSGTPIAPAAAASPGASKHAANVQRLSPLYRSSHAGQPVPGAAQALQSVEEGDGNVGDGNTPADGISASAVPGLVAGANAKLMADRCQHGQNLLSHVSRASLDEGPADALPGPPSLAASRQGSLKAGVAWASGTAEPASTKAGQEPSQHLSCQQHRLQHYRGDPALSAALHGADADASSRAAGSSQMPGHPGLSMHGSAPHAHGRMPAAAVRRVELVLLQADAPGSFPQGTAAWLGKRAHLARHHHVRLSRQADIQRLARWMAGKAVGIVLSGGGSRGLAHLGVLTALEDAGVPLDVVGGTSQGAFMAALYAQGLGRTALQSAVRQYAGALGSVRHLLADLTLPLLSVFSGNAFDDTIRSAMRHGAQRIEDLWLPFFCVTTNLTKGQASVHRQGMLWRLVRASMTIVGLLPPVWEDGQLLVDGGYLNNMPVDIMRGLGVDTVVVVDVEGKDDAGWRSLTPYDGGVSGWRMLWERWCPVPAWRTHMRLPRYSQIINQLTWMTHAHTLRRVAAEHAIDLYLRPPNIGAFKLMDYHLMDRLVADAHRYAAAVLVQWKSLHTVGPCGVSDAAPAAADAAINGNHSTSALPPSPHAAAPGMSAASALSMTMAMARGMGVGSQPTQLPAAAVGEAAGQRVGIPSLLQPGSQAWQLLSQGSSGSQPAAGTRQQVMPDVDAGSHAAGITPGMAGTSMLPTFGTSPSLSAALPTPGSMQLHSVGMSQLRKKQQMEEGSPHAVAEEAVVLPPAGHSGQGLHVLGAAAGYTLLPTTTVQPHLQSSTYPHGTGEMQPSRLPQSALSTSLAKNASATSSSTGMVAASSKSSSQAHDGHLAEAAGSTSSQRPVPEAAESASATALCEVQAAPQAPPSKPMSRVSTHRGRCLAGLGSAGYSSQKHSSESMDETGGGEGQGSGGFGLPADSRVLRHGSSSSAGSENKGLSSNDGDEELELELSGLEPSY